MSDASRSEPGHASQLELDRLLAGEERGMAAVRAHVEACAACRERLAACEAEQGARMTDAHVAARVSALMEDLESMGAAASGAGAGAAAGGVASRWLSRWWWAPLAAGAAAAAIVLLIVGPGDGARVRLRGSELAHAPVFQVLVDEPGGGAHPLAPRARVDADAELGFRATCVRRCQLVVGAVSASGPPAVVEHEDRPAPWQLAAEQWNRLPVGLQLTAPVRLVALFCERTPEREAFLAWLAARYPDGPRASPAADAPGTDCVVRSARVSPRAAR